ncbi:MAG: hypothetical protein ACP5PQ_06355, partial [Thermoproteota archaeon]
SLTYYLDQKLNISESSYMKIDRSMVLSVLGKELQFSLGEMLAEYLGGIRSYMILPDGKGDVDIVILDSKGKTPIIGYEVKIGEISESEAKKAVEQIHSQGIPRAGLVSLSEKPPRVAGSHEEIGPEELVDLAMKLRQHA